MSLRTSLDHHLATFGLKARIGERLALDANGVCALAFGEVEPVQVNIEWIADEGRVLFYVKVADVGRDPDPPSLRRLLDLDLYGFGTGGTILGFDGDTGEAVLTVSWGFDDLDYARFERLLEMAYVGAKLVRTALGGAASSGMGGATSGVMRAHEAAAKGGFFVIQR